MSNVAPDVKILFFGTAEFALPSLQALLRGDWRVVGVVTNPDAPVGRKQILTPPPVKVSAQKHGIPVFQPQRLNVETFKREVPPADLYLVAAYGKIIPKEILEIPKFKSLNIHPSLLPRWRGPSPIQYAILHGDTETGVTIIQMDAEVDHGPIVASSKYQVLSKKITYPELHDQLAGLGAELLIETIPKWVWGEITPVPQDESQATHSKMLKKEDGRIDWSRSAEDIERMVRAFNPWPGTWTTWPVGNTGYRLRIEEAEAIPVTSTIGAPGLVWQDPGRALLVQTGKGSLAIQRLTLEGKKSVDGGSFVRGYTKIIGSTLG